LPFIGAAGQQQQAPAQFHRLAGLGQGPLPFLQQGEGSLAQAPTAATAALVNLGHQQAQGGGAAAAAGGIWGLVHQGDPMAATS
jgi:hypothetical protein